MIDTQGWRLVTEEYKPVWRHSDGREIGVGNIAHALNEADANQRKAALADEVLGGTWDDWYEQRYVRGTDVECRFCGGLGSILPETIEHAENCPKARYDEVQQ